MKVLAKIFEDEGRLCLGNCGVYIEGVNIPFGENPHGGFNIGTHTVGAENIVISPEGKALFRQIVNTAQHTGDDISCLDIYQYDNIVRIGWLGGDMIMIDPNDLEGIFIGCGEVSPKLYLLDSLVEMDNETVKNLKLYNEKEQEEQEISEL